MIATAISAAMMELVWLFYFFLPEPVPASRFNPTAALDLERWNALPE